MRERERDSEHRQSYRKMRNGERAPLFFVQWTECETERGINGQITERDEPRKKTKRAREKNI